MAVISITSASQQNNILRKLTSHMDGFEKLRRILRSQRKAGGQYRESRLQHFVWQTPIMLLNFSIIIYIIGFLILIFHEAVSRGGGIRARESKVCAMIDPKPMRTIIYLI